MLTQRKKELRKAGKLNSSNFRTLGTGRREISVSKKLKFSEIIETNFLCLFKKQICQTVCESVFFGIFCEKLQNYSETDKPVRNFFSSS